MSLLWILVIALIILAVAGGAAVSSFLWLVLIVALIVAVVAIVSGRRAVQPRASRRAPDLGRPIAAALQKNLRLSPVGACLP